MSWDSGDTTTTCTYDYINRLTGATYHPGSAVTFEYDWVGNRKGTGWGAINVVDQLEEDPYGNEYGYELFYGNMEHRLTTGGNTTFEYDDYNLLKQINWPGSVNTQFVSDAVGNRIGMTTSDG